MAKKTKPPFGAKAAFVRAHASVPPAELVKLGAKEGLKLTLGHIYNIRGEEKRKQRPAAEPAPATASASAGPSSAALDAQLRTLVIRIGLDRAERVFSELKSSLSRVV